MADPIFSAAPDGKPAKVKRKNALRTVPCPHCGRHVDLDESGRISRHEAMRVKATRDDNGQVTAQEYVKAGDWCSGRGTLPETKRPPRGRFAVDPEQVD